jgi:hypothetical protein
MELFPFITKCKVCSTKQLGASVEVVSPKMAYFIPFQHPQLQSKLREVAYTFKKVPVNGNRFGN